MQDGERLALGLLHRSTAEAFPALVSAAELDMALDATIGGWRARLLDERLDKLRFGLTLFEFHTTFLVQHWLGGKGRPRR